MNTLHSDDDDVSMDAVAGLTAATAEALASGLPVVLLKDEKLVRISAQGEEVLKEFPPRVQVLERKRRVGT